MRHACFYFLQIIWRVLLTRSRLKTLSSILTTVKTIQCTYHNQLSTPNKNGKYCRYCNGNATQLPVDRRSLLFVKRDRKDRKNETSNATYPPLLVTAISSFKWVPVAELMAFSPPTLGYTCAGTFDNLELFYEYAVTFWVCDSGRKSALISESCEFHKCDLSKVKPSQYSSN